MSDTPPPDAPQPAPSDPGAGQGAPQPASDAPPPPPYAAPSPSYDAPPVGAPPAQPSTPQAPPYAPQPPQYAPSAPQVPPYAPQAPATGPAAPAYVQRYPGAPPQMTGPGGGMPPTYPMGTPGLAGAPGQPPADPRSKVMAIVALCLAIGGILLVWIPFIGIFGGLLLLGAIVLSIIALVMKSQGGKGFSIAALIIAGVGGLIALLVTAIFALIISATAASVDDYVNDPDSGYTAPEYGADQEIEILETATGAGDEETGLWWYAVVIENPNDVAFDYASITIEGLDADGNVVGEGSDYRIIAPGKTAITGYFTDIGDDVPVELNVELPPAADAAVIDAPDGELTVTDIQTTTDDSSLGLTELTATLTSTLSEDVDIPAVALIVRDASGTIVNADITYTEAVPAGGSVDFDTIFYPALPDGTTVEAYAYE